MLWHRLLNSKHKTQKGASPFVLPFNANDSHSHLGAPKLYYIILARVKLFRITYFTCVNKKQHNLWYNEVVAMWAAAPQLIIILIQGRKWESFKPDPKCESFRFRVNANDSHLHPKCECFSFQQVYTCCAIVEILDKFKCKNSGLAPRRPQVQKLGLVVQTHMPYNCYIKTRKALWTH